MRIDLERTADGRPLRLCVPVSPRDGVNYTHNTTYGQNIFGLNYCCNGDRVVTEKINNKGNKITTYHVFKSRPIFRSSELKPSRGGVWSETRGNGRNSQVVSLLFLFCFFCRNQGIYARPGCRACLALLGDREYNKQVARNRSGPIEGSELLRLAQPIYWAPMSPLWRPFIYLLPSSIWLFLFLVKQRGWSTELK